MRARDCAVDASFGRAFRAYARMLGDRFEEILAGEGLALRLRFRRDGALRTFSLMRDQRVFPRMAFNDTKQSVTFAPPCADWQAIARFSSGRTAHPPFRWRHDVLADRLYTSDDGEIFSLTRATVERVDALVRPYLDNGQEAKAGKRAR